MERPAPREFATLPDLLRGLGYDVTDGGDVGSCLEDHAESYLEHDADVTMTDRKVDESGEHVVLDADGIVMWDLGFPLSLGRLHDHLDDLNRRIGRRRTIAELADPADEVAHPEQVADVIARLFGVEAERVLDDLGASWTLIDSDAVGTHSNPVAHLRRGDLVVGLDDQYVHVFRTDSAGEVVDAYAEGVVWAAEWTDPAGADYAEFARTLREPAARTRHLRPPT